jgi:hypothetical protein
VKGSRVDQTAEDGDQWPYPKLNHGEYGKGFDGVWYCVPHRPTDRGQKFLGNLKNHRIQVHPDGAITVDPSILITRHDGRWHGFIEHGVWREV